MIAIGTPPANDMLVAIRNSHDVLCESCTKLEYVHLFHVHHVLNTCLPTLCVHVRNSWIPSFDELCTRATKAIQLG